MKYNPKIHNRRSIRLKDYDYSQPGAYFLTICTQNKLSLFGHIIDSEMRLNDAGRMVARWWGKLNCKFPNIQTDTFIIMPNHIHGIIIIRSEPVGADLCVCPNNKGAHMGAPLQKIVQWFKTMTTNEYIAHVKNDSWAPFPGRLWQRNYYEHIIRNQESLNRIRQYITENPARWAVDRENPEAKSLEPKDVWLI